MIERNRVVYAVLLMGALGLLGCSSPPPKDGRKGPEGPPEEAFKACSEKKAGDECSMKRGEEDVKGECQSPSEGSKETRLSCRPKGKDGHPRGDAPPPHADGDHSRGGPPKGQPPEEAFKACDGKKAGDTCSTRRGDEEVEGKCESPPSDAEDQRLMCRPPRPSEPQKK